MKTEATRRAWMASAGSMAVGCAALKDGVAPGNNPAAQVTEKVSNIRITAVKFYWVGPAVYVKIETNRSVSGWGDIKGVDPRVAKPLAEAMRPALIGENPTRIEHIWQRIFRGHRNLRGGAFMVHALAGIDIALWDLAGKLYGVPVYRLLGGPTRDRIRVYHTPQAKKVPPPGIFLHSETPASIDRIVASIARAREQVGAGGAVMFDAHSAIPPAALIQLAGRLKPHDVLFIEEPAVPGNIEVFKRLKAAINIPLAAGERDRTIWGMIPYLQERCLDILQPDCNHTGGISQMKKIATLAEAYHVPLAPHCTATLLGIAASLHTVASIPFFLIHEFYPNNRGFNPGEFLKMDWKLDAEGYISLPPGPGLGVEVDEKRLAELAAQPQSYKWPGRTHPDGSVADY